MKIRREGLAFTIFLGALSALPSLSIDMGVPAIPSIEAAFAGADGQGALTLSMFMLGFSISPLLAGPFADHVGRRPVVLAGLLLFAAGALLAAVVPDFRLMLAARLVQGFAAGACAVLPLAIVRDLFDGDAARSRLSQVTAVLGIAPMLAPVLGGWLVTAAGWSSIYVAQGACGLIVLAVAAAGFEEPLDRRHRAAFDLRTVGGNYRRVFTDRRFVGFATIYALTFACMFSYISAASAVLMGEAGLSESQFSLTFAATACGTLIGAFLSTRVAKRGYSAMQVIGRGLAIMAAASVAMVALALGGALGPWTLVPLAGLVLLCFGLISPSVNQEALANLGDMSGSASGAIRCTQMLLGAAASGLVAVLTPYGHPALVMAALILGFVTIACLWFRLVTSRCIDPAAS